MYGFINEQSDNIQPSGSIIALTDRCVTFPNFHHHRVEPFELEDGTRPGHRKILCFFLVHPENTIASTKYVPCQDYNEIMLKLGQCFRTRLPEEAICRIMEFAGAPITREEGVILSHELSEERKSSVAQGYAAVHKIFLCEH